MAWLGTSKNTRANSLQLIECVTVTLSPMREPRASGYGAILSRFRRGNSGRRKLATER
jgi:hypothetical protein